MIQVKSGVLNPQVPEQTVPKWERLLTYPATMDASRFVAGPARHCCKETTRPQRLPSKGQPMAVG